MARSRRWWIGVLLGGAAVTAAVLSWRGFLAQEPERWFIPGALGHEAGHRPNPIGAKAFLTRALGGVERTDGGEWGRRNGVTKRLEFSHALSGVFPPELYQTHPEFFPFVDGQRLQPPKTGRAFWNPDLGRADVAQHAADTARKYFDAHPAEESFALGMNDGFIWGESPETLALISPMKWFRERPDFSPLMFTFMNRVADDVAKTHPQKLLGTLAYYFAENIPPFPIRPNIVPFLTADRSQGYDEAFKREELHLQEQWAQSGAKRIGMYDYLYGSGFLIPRIHTQLLAENLTHARRVGFTDYFAEVNPNWALDGPMPWLTAQLLSDPTQSRKVLLEEYYRRYFREAAGPMRQFFERCEQQWMSQTGPSYWLKHFRDDSQAGIFPSAVCGELRRMLDDAARLARTSAVRARVQLASEGFGVTERFVAFEEIRDRLSRAILAKGAGKSLAAPLHAYLLARREFIRYTENLRREAPLAIAPFGWDDYLKNDPLPAALLAMQENSPAPDLATLETEFLTWNEPRVQQLWSAVRNPAAEVNVERNGALEGPLSPARRIAGLDYGLSLPAEWLSRVEPSQYFQAGLKANEHGQTLRIAGTKDTMMFQWDPVSRSGLHTTSVWLKGHVSPGAAVIVTLGWLDANERTVGFSAFRLCDGDWMEPVKLEVAALPPTGARWVGLGIHIQNQVRGDWIEASDFQLRAR